MDPQLVKQLREKTSAGFMDCKKALAESAGDLEKAEAYLRTKGIASAGKKASRATKEGIVASYIHLQGKVGVLVEVNCETDFVAKNDDFLKFAASLADLVAKKNPADVAALSSAPLGGSTVEETRKALVGRIGENMSIRRFARIEAKGRIAHYVHGAKIGVLVDISGGDDQFAREIAQHISWAKPIALSKDGVPAESIKKERDIATAQAAASGKPPNIMEKMVEGGVQKYLNQVTLLGQSFVKDEKQSVEAVLKAKGASISSFVLYVVGEGIEKRSGDFAAEVMEQVSKAKKDENKSEKAA